MLLAQVGSLTGYIFIVLLIAGSCMLAYGIYQVVVDSGKRDHKRIVERMRGASGGESSNAARTAELLRQSAAELDAQGGLSGMVSKLSFVPRLQTTIDQANFNISAARLLINLTLGALATLALLLILQRGALTSFGVATGIIVLPLFYISFRRKRRMRKLTYQLPDVFAMMSQALRAGHSLASAIQLVQEQMPDPIATEFGRVFHEQNLGIKIEDALMSMADRIDQLDVRFFVTAVLIQRQTGGDLAEVLDKISTVIRQRIELFAMVLGLTAEGRLSGWVLFALPFLVFLAVNLLNPAYAAQLFEDPRGKVILVVALGMQLMGLAMIRWIVNIKV